MTALGSTTFPKVRQVGAVGAGEVGADLSAGVVEGVALHAGLVYSTRPWFTSGVLPRASTSRLSWSMRFCFSRACCG